MLPPGKIASEPIQRKDVRVIRHHETRSPASATPRLNPPVALPINPCVFGRWKCQSCRPVPASSAQHSFALVTYIMPSTTTGVVSARVTPGIVNIQLSASRETLFFVICTKP
jgi:hypothetical protein